MKKAIKIASNTMIIMFVLLGGMHWFKSYQEEKRLIRQDQERMAQYILDNVELVDGNEIKKIEFLRFERPDTTARSWWIRVELNSKYQTYLTEGALGGELRFSGFYAEEISIRKQEKRTIDKNNIEIIYVKGKQ